MADFKSDEMLEDEDVFGGALENEDTIKKDNDKMDMSSIDSIIEMISKMKNSDTDNNLISDSFKEKAKWHEEKGHDFETKVLNSIASAFSDKEV